MGKFQPNLSPKRRAQIRRELGLPEEMPDPRDINPDTTPGISYVLEEDGVRALRSRGNPDYFLR